MMRFRTIKTLSLALAVSLILGQAPLLAAPAARIEGRVFGADLKTPVANYGVQAYERGSKTPAATTTTGKDGRFRLDSVPAGNYVLVLADGQGHAIAAAEVAAKDGVRSSVTLALPDKKPGEGRLAPAQSGGGFFGTTGGAILTIVGSAVVLALAADSLVDDDETPQAPVSPSQPGE